MARYKPLDDSPRFLPVDLRRQLLPGTFEFAVDWLVDHHLNLTGFDNRYRNDTYGASAYPPGMLHKVILIAYGWGIPERDFRWTASASAPTGLFMSVTPSSSPPDT